MQGNNLLATAEYEISSASLKQLKWSMAGWWLTVQAYEDKPSSGMIRNQEKAKLHSTQHADELQSEIF